MNTDAIPRCPSPRHRAPRALLTAWLALPAALAACGPLDDDTAADTLPQATTTAGLTCAPLIAEIDAGMGHPCARKTDGTLVCWGSNRYGQVGDGTANDRAIPATVAALGSSVAHVEGGGTHECAAKTDGTLWCWGRNANGQLGDGTTTDRLTPVQVTTLSNVAEVTLGIAHTCARKVDGSLWCWGYNAYGALGDGTTTQRTLPVQVTALGTSVAQISAGEYHTCARRKDGYLFCWGDGVGGQLGDGTAQHRYVPTRLTAFNGNVAEVASGSAHTCARKTDGTLWCWGYNIYGALGNGTTTYTPSPIQVKAMGASVAQVSVGSGGFHTCARKLDNTVWCWGSSWTGDGTTTDRLTPVQVTALGTSTVQLSAGGGQTCALRNDDTVWCWGANNHNQVGDGTTTDRSLPTRTLLPACSDPPPAPTARTFRGTTGQSVPIDFDVDATGAAVTRLKTAWSATACGMTGTTEIFASSPIASGAFTTIAAGSCPTVQVSGAFPDAKSASGTVTLSFSGTNGCGCVGTATVPWSATTP
jgi:alpha-tubulin suppressor-like RCC1 family protein